MNRNSFSLLALVVFLSVALAPASGRAQELGDTISAPGVFSYQAPKGWTVKDAPASKYKVALDAPNNNFSANINVVVETFSGSLDQYVEKNKAALKSAAILQNVQVVDDKAFTTADGTVGVRMVATDTYGKTDLRQVFYFFAGTGDTKFVVTATSLPADGDKYAPIFDASMKTFTLK